MNKMISKTLMAAAVTAACAFSAPAAFAQIAGTEFSNFTIAPFGDRANFDADKITGNYVEIANFDNAGNFSVSLRWDAFGFLSNDGKTRIAARDSGLGVDYDLYAMYTASGTYTTDGLKTTFTFQPDENGSLQVFLDPNGDSSFTEGATAIINANTGDDIRLANGVPLRGQGLLDPTLSTCGGGGGEGINCGSFGSTTSFVLTDAGSDFFVAPSPFYQLSFQSGQLNNFNPSGRQVINGSLDVVFGEVPEPASLALLGLGLAGLAMSRRRSKKA